MEIIETVEYKGHDIQIVPDYDPQNPRTEWDNFGTIVAWHSRYDLSDKDPSCRDNEEFQEYLRSEPCVVLPIYMYDHSGISLNTSGYHCPWDSDQVGWIYVTHYKIREEWSKWKVLSRKRVEQIEALLSQEVETFSEYLSGNVCGYVIEGELCEDSCSGYYERDALLQDAKGMIDWAIAKQYKAKEMAI